MADYGDGYGDYGGGYDGGSRGGGGGGFRGGASKRDDDARKIFVGGLSWETTADEMSAYFSKFGEVLDSTLKTDPGTGRSRGFGFVLFEEVETVAKVCDQESPHTLNGRTISPQRVRSKGGEPTKKVFVGGVDPDTPEQEISDHFSKFGEVEDIHLPFDKMKGQRRGFCFVTFKSEAVVDQVVAQSRQMLGGKEVDVKKATPKEREGGGGGGWGRGGGGGGYGYGDGYERYGGGGGGGYGRSGGWGGGYSQGGYGSGGGYGGGSSGWGQQNSSYSSYGGGNDYYSQGGGYGGY